MIEENTTPPAPEDDTEFMDWYVRLHGEQLHSVGEGCGHCDRYAWAKPSKNPCSEMSRPGRTGETMCPTCGSDDQKKFRAWSTAFGGMWIPWFKCPDKWHEVTENQPSGQQVSGGGLERKP